jgi:hypothetical protein
MASAQNLALSVEAYLRMLFRPDVDCIDGFIEERNLGERDHGRLTYILARYFRFWTQIAERTDHPHSAATLH